MMKKLLILAMAIAFGTNISTYAQSVEAAPYAGTNNTPPSSNALFDQLFNYDIFNQIGAQGNAGVCFVNGQYWVSAWASANIHVLDAAGNFVETFTIPGVTGTRSMTYDGTSIFIGTASTTIYEINPVSRTIEGTIIISPSTDATARMCAFDPTLDGGDGGFWTGNFSSDIASFDMNGNELSVIPFANHGGAIYGGAVDLVTPGGPYLWIADQGAAGGQTLVRQFALPAGTDTGLVYDYNTSGQQPAGNTSIAGGLFISDEVVAGKTTIIGIGQGTPNDQLFGIELAESAGVNDFNSANFNIYPNPASGNVINIKTGVTGEKLVTVYDVLGKQVINTTIDSELNISSLKAGVYMVSVTQNNATITKKLVVQ
jgi:hypothetical protein